MVTIIVAATMAWALRHFTRIFSNGLKAGGKGGCGCSGSNGCVSMQCDENRAKFSADNEK